MDKIIRQIQQENINLKLENDALKIANCANQAEIRSLNYKISELKKAFKKTLLALTED